MTPKIQVHLILDLKNLIKKSNLNQLQIVHSQTLPHRCSALAGAARTTLANPLTFIASGAAVVFWFFSATEKGLGPRGYERVKYLGGWWVTPTTGKFDFLPLVRRTPLEQ